MVSKKVAVLLVSLSFFILQYFTVSYKNLKDMNFEAFGKFDSTGKIVIIEPNFDTLNLSVDMKYILIWTPPSSEPISYMGFGQNVFKKNKCKFTNCFVTSNKNLFDDVTKFDVILFHGPDLMYYTKAELPKQRKQKQLFVFASIESSHNYPICNKIFDNYFNWTWTYRLDSDERWGYIVVRDMNGNVIGPNQEMHWIKDMDPINDELKRKLDRKTKAVAWFTSSCYSMSNRHDKARRINEELSKYNLYVDIYGACGTGLECPKHDYLNCLDMLEREYFFYLAFENSLSEDYVTEKIFTPLNSSTVPIVLGYANYTRFLPDGAYLNAMTDSPIVLAKKIFEAIHNPDIYYDFFRWKNYYTFHLKTVDNEANEHCSFCKLLNNRTAVETKKTYKDFRGWWNTKYEDKCVDYTSIYDYLNN